MYIMNKIKSKGSKVDLSEILRGVGDPHRLKIFCVLFSGEKGCVTELAKLVSLNIAITSHHLRTLHRLGLLEVKRDGKNVCYSLAKGSLAGDLKKLVCKHLNN